MKSLAANAAYKKFVTERDEALEVILNRYLLSVTESLDHLKSQVVNLALGMHASSLMNPLFMESLKPEIDRKVGFYFKQATAHIAEIARQMRVSTYTLAHRSEVEAISRAAAKPKRADVSDDVLSKVVNRDSPSGGPLKARIDFFLLRLKNTVFEEFLRSMLLEEDSFDIRKRFERTFPQKVEIASRPRRVLKKVREADSIALKGKKVSLNTGYVSDEAWEKVVDDYMGAYLPGPRGPQDIAEFAGEERYLWEVEKELTQDFVELVRQGQHDAAKNNGIKDMMWIAIVDDKTDDCCLKRDGLTSTEIELKLESEWKDDECTATVTPAHFNCRCTMAPVYQDAPESAQYDYGDFDEWLNAQ